MAVTIRHVTEQDGDAWLTLRFALWPDCSLDEHRAEVRRYLAGEAREPQAVLLAERAGEVVGFVELSLRAYAEGCSSDRVAFLEGWYVAPEHRRRGIGRALVATAERWALAQGCSEFASDTEVDNEPSRKAHYDCGFSEVAVIRCFRKQLPAADEGDAA